MGGEENHTWRDVLGAVLLGVATIVSAYCGYQATRWGGNQTWHQTMATNRQFESMHKSTAADREALVDVATFFNLHQAMVRRDERMIQFIRAHARREFRGPLEAWYQAAVGHPDVPPPFERPDYHMADAVAAERLHAVALEASAAAARANANADKWVLHTVIVALALFFFGVSTQARLRFVRRMTLALGTLTLAAMMVSVALLPRAPPEDNGVPRDDRSVSTP